MAKTKDTQATKTPQKRSGSFLKGVKSEFKKIIWPTKKELLNYTLVVIVISLIVALIIYGLDFVFTGLLGLLIK